MKLRTILSSATLCATLTTMSLLGGCSSDSSDNGGSNSDLVGIWQYTEANVEQETIRINSNGSFDMVYADYIFEECDETDGTWDADVDSIYVTMTEMGFTQTFSSAYTVSGSTLTITDEDGDVTTFTSTGTLPTCESYGFDGGGQQGDWAGTLTANVGGTNMDFSDFIYADVSPGAVAFGGNNGTGALQFNLLGDAVGTYTLSTTNMGVYLPDNDDITNVFTTVMMMAEGNLELTTVSTTQIVGTFSFEAINLSVNPPQTLSITNGVVNITLQ